MKEKIKKFLLEKKELLIFIGVVVFVFASVIGVASIALSNQNNNNNDDVDNVQDVIDPLPDNTEPDEPDSSDPVVVEPSKFSLPITGDYVVVRTYFDLTLDDEKLASAIITNGQTLTTSKGISYAKEDNSVFDVLAIFDGTVKDIVTDDLEGTTITITHSNNVESIYYSLAEVTLTKGQTVKQGDTLGKSSTSINDSEAGIHVHLEIKIDNEYVNPTNVFGSSIDDLVTTK